MTILTYDDANECSCIESAMREAIAEDDLAATVGYLPTIAHPVCRRCGGFLMAKDDLVDGICIRCHRETPMPEPPPTPMDEWAAILDSPVAPPEYDLDGKAA